MEITDPTALLRDIDQGIWSKSKIVVGEGNVTSEGNGKNGRLLYTEPSFLLPSPKPQTAFARSQNGTPMGNKVPPICSKAILLGDYIDTDAVSDVIIFVDICNIDFVLARSI